jgi:hypothetical protein
MLSAFRLIEVACVSVMLVLVTRVTWSTHKRCVFSRSFVVYLQALALHAWVDLRLPTSWTLPFQPSSSPRPHWPVEWYVFPPEVQAL